MKLIDNENDEEDTAILLAETNKLLSAVGISAKKILSIEELARVASSMFVAVFESLFRFRVEGINRNPRSREDYAANAQHVINHVSEQIQMDLKHISGHAIVDGEFRALSNLVHIFVRILSITRFNLPAIIFETRLS